MLPVLDNDHQVCSRCTSCCCYTSSSGTGPGAPLSYSDVVRAASHTGKKARELAQLADQPSRQSLAAIRDQVPSMSPLYERDQYIHLKHKDGACILLNESGRCSLPRDVRPRYCAFYPLWFEFDPLTQDVSLEVVGSRACQAAVESNANAEAILKMFRFPREEMMALVQRTRTEIREHRTISDEALATLNLSREKM